MREHGRRDRPARRPSRTGITHRLARQDRTRKPATSAMAKTIINLIASSPSLCRRTKQVLPRLPEDDAAVLGEHPLAAVRIANE